MTESVPQGNADQVRRKAGRPKRADGKATSEARYTVPDTLLTQLERLAAVRGASRDSVITALLAAGVTDMAMGSPGSGQDRQTGPAKAVHAGGPSAQRVAEMVASDLEAQVDQALDRHLARIQEQLVEDIDAMIEERISGRTEHAIDVLSARLAERDVRLALVVEEMSRMVADISADCVRTRTRTEGLADESGRLLETTRMLSTNISAVLETLAGVTGITLRRAG